MPDAAPVTSATLSLASFAFAILVLLPFPAIMWLFAAPAPSRFSC